MVGDHCHSDSGRGGRGGVRMGEIGDRHPAFVDGVGWAEACIQASCMFHVIG